MRYKFLRFPEGKLKAVTFSYDDGCREDAVLVKLLDKYGIKCTFNVCSSFIQHPGSKFLSLDEVTESLANSHHELAVHGDKHRAPGVNTPIDIIHDVLDCRMQLEQMFGRIIRGMAYPDTGIKYFENGTSYADVKRILTDLGIVYARSLRRDDSFLLPTDWHDWAISCSGEDHNAIEVAEKFLLLNETNCTNSKAGPRLFYAFGHAYAADLTPGGRMEQLLATLGGKDDTWYATNIEIYDYVTAYRSLVFSADGSLCYNPTLIDVWFVVDTKPYLVRSGETVHVTV